MSTLHNGDAQMHYSDNSHRWIAPPDVDQSVWEAGMRAHLALHRVTLGGPATVEDWEARPVRIPRQRTAEPTLAPAPTPALAPTKTPTPKTVTRRRTAVAIRQLPRAG
jgi:hypothetical protein